MDPQIIKLINIIHSEKTKQAELYHRGIKHGEYYTWWKRAQKHLRRVLERLNPNVFTKLFYRAAKQ
jgi:hypothetical protein